MTALSAAIRAVERDGALDLDPLTVALRERFLRDPKLAREVVTGECWWDEGTVRDDIMELCGRAADLRYDLEQAAKAKGEPAPSFRRAALRAAEDAFGALAEDAPRFAPETDLPHGGRGRLFGAMSQRDFL